MASPSVLDPRRLETFRVVAEVGQVSGAARRLNLSQPAVTAQIRRLEGEAGQPLFTRHAGGMRLTAAGERMLDYATRIRGLLEEAAQVGAPEGAPPGPLHLAVSTTVAGHILPPLLQGYLARRRPRGLQVDVGNTEDVLVRVREGRVPLGMVEGLDRAPGLTLEPFLRDELVAVRGPRGPLAQTPILSARALDRVPILWREEGSGTRVVVERALARAGLGRLPREGDLVLGDTEGIKGCVLAGLGIGFLSRWSLQRELARGEVEILPLADLAILRTFSWVQAGGGLSGEPLAFLRWARQHPPALTF